MTAARRKIKLSDPPPPCPNQDAHTPCPEDYVGWHGWAEKMAATHDQQECPGCGKWAIWVPATDFCDCGHPVFPHDADGFCSLWCGRGATDG